jgi:HTH-type transcriptional regulator, sugar sensing transcriptional regulator
MDVSILEDLGLTNAEIKVYIALLELGNSSAGPLLEKTGLQNSVVHRALHSLIDKGLISFILEGKRKLYQASDPQNFYAYLEDKKSRFDQLLPELEKKRKQSKVEKETNVFRGKKGINQIYTELLNSGGKEYNTFGGGKDVTYEVMGEDWWRNLHIRRIAKKIKSRQVFDTTIEDYGNELNKMPFTHIKFLPQEFAQLTETVIIGDRVGIIIFTSEPYGILIHDKEVAEGYRKHFELLWKAAKN